MILICDLGIRDIFGPLVPGHFGDIFVAVQEGRGFIIIQYVFYTTGLLQQCC
jgi:hypothetical protein